MSRPRPTIKTDCKAKINANLVKGTWVVTTVENAHNHNMVSPQKSRFFRSHKYLDEYSERMLDLNDIAGIRVNKNFRVLVVDVGGFKNPDFQEKDCRNFIDKTTQLRLGKRGGEALTEYFKRMRLQNNSFVYVIDMDEELRLRNVLWANTIYIVRGWVDFKRGYEYFCAVVSSMKYDLGDNPWLQGLYNERAFWVPVYLKGVFWGGMSITQRSKSMNTFFDVLVYAGMTLKELVDQFDNALRKKVEVKKTADFNSASQTIPCSFAFHIEKQFQAVYMNAKFKEVQREVCGMILCNCILISKEGCISTYDVLDEITTDDDHVKSVKYTVYFNEEKVDVKCTCVLFEMRGILCRHALNVCQMNKIHALPDKYILDRWRKDLKRRYTVVKSSYDDLWQNADSQRYEFVVKRCLKLATRVCPSDDHVDAFMCHLDEFKIKFKGLTLESGSSKIKVTTAPTKGKKILNPHVVREKGRPPTKRKVPPLKKATTKRKKKPTCKKIFDEASHDSEVTKAPITDQVHSGSKDDFVVLTQCSTFTNSTPSENEEN
ncbi:protein FAR-RED IMPAIRED RESPONSE 1-like [Carya illinoinensis]|uniref:protein FAR-RED IMPAIRED RESPONSE 1-like n=1 Tax=Carya illinoinensis TaxID=32201 RepID=UPI001C721925|nr:protein FAR-RED IMPAIRED RESPONSE 1-like [Carya illinoinensis]